MSAIISTADGCQLARKRLDYWSVDRFPVVLFNETDTALKTDVSVICILHKNENYFNIRWVWDEDKEPTTAKCQSHLTDSAGPR